MANLGDTAKCRRALYELNKACSADIPERGEFYTFDEYLAERVQTRRYDPSGVVLAVSNDLPAPADTAAFGRFITLTKRTRSA